jgi:hypothetical protein
VGDRGYSYMLVGYSYMLVYIAVFGVKNPRRFGGAYNLHPQGGSVDTPPSPRLYGV